MNRFRICLSESVSKPFLDCRKGTVAFREIRKVFFMFRSMLPVLNLYVVKSRVRWGGILPAICRLQAFHCRCGCCPMMK